MSEKRTSVFSNGLISVSYTHLHNPYNDWTLERIKARVMELDDIREIGEIMGYLGLKKHAVWTGEWHNMSGVGFFIMPKGGRLLAHFQHSSQEDRCDCTNVRDLTRVEDVYKRQRLSRGPLR